MDGTTVEKLSVRILTLAEENDLLKAEIKELKRIMAGMETQIPSTGYNKPLT